MGRGRRIASLERRSGLRTERGAASGEAARRGQGQPQVDLATGAKWFAALGLIAGALGCEEEAPRIGNAPSATSTLEANPTALHFGQVEVNDGATDSIVATNKGGANLQIDVIQITGPGRDSFSASPNDLLKLGPGRSKRILVTFAPRSGGEQQARLVLFHDGSGDPVEVLLDGVGHGCVDEDNDTYGEGCAAGPDCADDDRERHPMAMELCDGVDNDCDMMIDEGFSNTTYYVDADDDLYGSDAAPTTEACAPPPGHVDRGGDCNDAVPAANPDGTEVCTGGIDEDCDMKTDGEDEDCMTPDPTCDDQDDCGLNTNNSACPMLGVTTELCRQVCRRKTDCAAGEACRPLPGSASLGFCGSAGTSSVGESCSSARECVDGICVQGRCRPLCQNQTDCTSPDICGVALYNTSELDGRSATRLTTVCRPVGARQPIGGSCLLSPTEVDTGLCATEHCDLPPWSAMATTAATCAPVCSGAGDCGANEVCGLVYNGLAESPTLPSTNEAAGRYYEGVLGCYTPYFRLNQVSWQYNPPGTGALGAICDPNRSEGRLACRSHLCAQFDPIRGKCTDFCDEDRDCLSPSTPDWVCRYGELSLTGIFLQSYDVADITKFVLVGVCAP